MISKTGTACPLDRITRIPAEYERPTIAPCETVLRAQKLPVLYRAQILTYLIAAAPGPARGGGRVQRRRRPAADQRRVPVRPESRYYLAAGTPEPGFLGSAREWAERLRRAGLPCRHEEWIGGHDQAWWQQLPVALGWLLRA
jgi:hypothetical protein